MAIFSIVLYVEICTLVMFEFFCFARLMFFSQQV
jgi:hypothetical protein